MYYYFAYTFCLHLKSQLFIYHFFQVGTIYWYECRKGFFDFNNGTLKSYMELMCVNDETGLGGAPYWSPPYDGINVPFPKCTVLCKYFRVRKRYKGM